MQAEPEFDGESVVSIVSIALRATIEEGPSSTVYVLLKDGELELMRLTWSPAMSLGHIR